jgi:hypothetical protein
VTLRFFAGGGLPPQSHEVLVVPPDGQGWYLTGMPWPEQPPFDEIGTYRAAVGPEGYDRLAGLAEAVLAGREPEGRYADTGGESIRLDGRERSWSPRERSPGAQALIDAVRSTIAAARDQPIAVARAVLGGDSVRLANCGERALAVEDGELRVGWGPADHPPSPLRLATADATPVELPATLEPGAALSFPRSEPGPVTDPEFATLYALVGLRWRPDVRGEPPELDGWIIAGP